MKPPLHAPRLPRAALVLALVACAPALATAQDRGPTDVEGEVQRLLEAAPADEAPAQALADELVALGAGAAPALLGSLSGEPPWSAPLEGWRRDAVVDTLTRLPRAPVVSALGAVAREQATVEERVACLDVLACVAGEGEVGMLLRVAGCPQDQWVRRGELTRAFERALSTTFEREPALTAVVAAQMREAPPALLVTLVRALGRAPLPGRLEVLAGQLGRVPGADVLLLGEVERLARRAPYAVRARLRTRVRPLLESTDAFVAVGACRAAEALDDLEAVETLIGLLASRQPPLRAAAHDSLKALTGLHLDPDQASWSAWFTEQERWWRGDGRRQLEAVRGGERAALAPALTALAKGALHREEIVPAVTPLLGDDDPNVARLAASVLGNLRSRQALPALAAALARGVASAARRALRSLVGSDLGPRPGAWLALPH